MGKHKHGLYSGVIVWTGYGITHPLADDCHGHRRGALL